MSVISKKPFEGVIPNTNKHPGPHFKKEPKPVPEPVTMPDDAVDSVIDNSVADDLPDYEHAVGPMSDGFKWHGPFTSVKCAGMEYALLIPEEHIKELTAKGTTKEQLYALLDNAGAWPSPPGSVSSESCAKIANQYIPSLVSKQAPNEWEKPDFKWHGPFETLAYGSVPDYIIPVKHAKELIAKGLSKKDLAELLATHKAWPTPSGSLLSSISEGVANQLMQSPTADWALESPFKPMFKPVSASAPKTLFLHKQPLPGRQAIEDWGLIRGFNLTEFAADFYILYKLHTDTPNDSALSIRVTQHAKMMALQMSKYMDAASGGELRHARSHPSSGAQHGYLSGSNMHNYLVRVRSLDRWTAWSIWKLARDKYGLDILKDASTAFGRLQWGSSFGGKKWKSVVDALIPYLESKHSAIMFIDHAFGVEHNCGPVFNKLWDVSHMREIYRLAFEGDMDQMCKYASKEVVSLYEK